MASQNWRSRSFAQSVNLTPPPLTSNSQRSGCARASKSAQPGRNSARPSTAAPRGEQGRARVNPVEVARVWSSLAFRDLRDSLTESEQEKLRAHLAAYMAGETTPAVWHAAVNAVTALRRASETAVGAPRQWRQTWPSMEDW